MCLQGVKKFITNLAEQISQRASEPLPSIFLQREDTLRPTAMGSRFEEHLLSEYDSTTLTRYILESESCKDSSRVFFLSPNLIAKQFLCGEEIGMLNALQLATILGVRVPDIKRTIKTDENVYIIMERIRGQTLEEAWIHLSWFMTLRLAFQLRQFIHRMRAQTSTTAGSLSDGACTSVWIDDYYGLPSHASPESISAFIHFWLNFVPPSRYKPGKQHYKEFLSQHHVPLVFTHQDLAPRNIIVDDRCHLWLLDWDHSGWYPVYFEYASMQNFDVPSSWRWTDRLRWKLFSWISVGLFPQEHRALEQARMRFTRHPLGRKNEVLPEGVPARAVHLRKPGM
ncbi:hypothetical protein LOZ12_006886 [Ophidiomyces ophidiicola]|uniref:Uncharacterized protein n=1 Tax=Ophidiomyces ophidiicola TaxID=1387563 RepID=A0ACB8UM41_9EURO|nr:uncharacterized protein LOZ57_005535 [Ophidiomyces ophidiicola]KAI1929758.1 hypothetical protein LOZ62_006895 [Ophidiomyces ophidiicola]KAI1941744.1 hypothetical protein LOZ57_005535 [Ophidiomyces ophidiicola]KAI1959190.1 hypothetical protein LOZ56_006849 [Ophidiomyces ophidiicola]KAI2004318.1 hypothetical protein LOZ50_004364 [Ophidiomyces ophidiicola]KAI2008333.1 hypothetical protein LOZ46_006636 [Ophidiomyces ophidiicola]